MRIYVAGPMQGHKDFNYPAFDAAAAKLRAMGHDVVSPAEVDREEGFDGISPDGKIDPALRRRFLGRDFLLIADCDAVYMLKGWEKSGGAKLERAFAMETGLKVLYEEKPAPYQESGGEVRVTDPKTGGQKGQKLAQLGAVDPLALLEVAKVAGFGAQKYARMNFAKGYSWSLSFDAMQRHLLLFWSGEDRDEESGQLHLAHAAWHTLALLCFSLRQLGTDDRLKSS